MMENIAVNTLFYLEHSKVYWKIKSYGSQSYWIKNKNYLKILRKKQSNKVKFNLISTKIIRG